LVLAILTLSPALRPASYSLFIPCCRLSQLFWIKSRVKPKMHRLRYVADCYYNTLHDNLTTSSHNTQHVTRQTNIKLYNTSTADRNDRFPALWHFTNIHLFIFIYLIHVPAYALCSTGNEGVLCMRTGRQYRWKEFRAVRRQAGTSQADACEP